MNQIASIWDRLFGGLPGGIAAILVLILAFIVAAIAKTIAKKLMQFVKFDRLLAKSKLDNEHREKIKSFIANLVYLIVFVLFLPGVFEKLGLNNVASPIMSMMNAVMVYLPNIIAAVVLLIIGFFVARLIYGLLETALSTTKLDIWAAKIFTLTDAKTAAKFSLSKVIAEVVRWLIVVFFIVEALSTLQLEILTQIGNQIVAYLPYGISAVIILGVAILFGRWLEKWINSKFKNAGPVALIARIAIDVIGVMTMLYQLGIAPAMINTAFILLFGAFSVAFAIAFGVGGRDFAARTLNRLEKKFSSNNKK